MVDQSAHWPSSAHAFHGLLKLNETDNFSDAISNYEPRLHVLAFAVSHKMFAPSFHSCYAIHPIIFASHPFMSFMSFILLSSSFFWSLPTATQGPQVSQGYHGVLGMFRWCLPLIPCWCLWQSGDLENRIYELQLQLREGRLGDSVQHAEVPLVMPRCGAYTVGCFSFAVRRNVKLRRVWKRSWREWGPWRSVPNCL